MSSKHTQYSGCSVGIGITRSEALTNPDRHFVVSSGSPVQTMLSLNNSSQGHATIGLDADGGQVSGTDYLLLRQKNNLTSVIGNWAKKPLLLKTDGTERMRIGRGGNIGVGTSSPNEKLTVAGTVLAEEVIVKLQSAWANVDFEEKKSVPSFGLSPHLSREAGTCVESLVPDSWWRTSRPAKATDCRTG